MTKYAANPTGVESPFDEEEIIVSKTDVKGRIAYANSVFLRVGKFALDEIVGQPHSIIRHPSMPRCIFKLLWDTIQAKKEIFAYVLNMASNGDHYWVLAHVTPSFDESNNVIGFHSNRRKPTPSQLATIKPIYDDLLAEERRHEDRKVGMDSAYAKLSAMLKQKGLAYDEFIFSF
jgi:PAS domain-containing protein